MAASAASVKDILENFRQGCETERSFRTLFETYYARVVQFLQHKGLSHEDARDLAQEVFVSVYKEVRNLRDIDRFESWLFTLTRNAFHSYLDRIGAKKRREPKPAVNVVEEGESHQGALDLIADARKDQLAEIIDREKVELLYLEMAGLPPQMRQCVFMRVVDDAPLDEIARKMSIAVNTVKAHLHQARRLLRKRLEPSFGPLDFTGDTGNE